MASSQDTFSSAIMAAPPPPPPATMASGTKHSASHLKTVQADQISRLQHKHQHDIELLEDIRLFTKQRATIEKEYAQALCKVAQQYLSKGKFPPTPDLTAEDGQEHKTVSEVWKTVLEETDQVGKIRLQAAETYLQQISEPCKPIKTSKTITAKKVFEQIKTLQKEIDHQFTELVKSQKSYNEDEHVTHEATTKANEAESKVKNKSTGIFTSLAKLQQISAKLTGRKEACAVKSTSSRNEYLLNLASTNANLDRYYSCELPELIKSLDGEMFGKVREFFIALSKMEVDCCGLTQERFMKILTDSTLISRQFDHQCFLHNNLVFSDKVQYNFEAQENDQVNHVSTEYQAYEALAAEAKKLAQKMAHQGKVICTNQRKITLLQNAANGSSKGSEPSSPTNPVDPSSRIEELRFAMRRAETNRRKAEARLEAIRLGGVNVDEYVMAAQAEVDAQIDQDVEEDEVSQKSGRSPSVSATSTGAKSVSDSVTDSKKSVSDSVGPSGNGGGGSGDSKTRSRTESQTDGANGLPTTAPDGSTYVNYQEDDYDETFVTTGSGQQEEGSMGYASLGQSVAMKALAVYDFQATNADELTITENENLEIIGEGEGDGWVQARNVSGQIGFVPHNYIQYTDQIPEDKNEMYVDQDTNGDQDSTVATSAGYDSASASVASMSAPPSAGPDSLPPSAGFTTGGSLDRGSNYSNTDYEVQQAVRPTDINTGVGSWARALYEFEATCDEELSFCEGQLIRILQKDENGVDDGWWKGEIDGKIGVFPSLVVEEITQQYGAEDLASPNRPGPPAFTPPEPGPPPPQLEVTQPTPSDESSPTVDTAASNESFPPPPPETSGPESTEDSTDEPPPPPPPEEAKTNGSTDPDDNSTSESDPPPPPPPPPPEFNTSLDIQTEDPNDDAASMAVNYNSDSVDTFSTINDDADTDAKSKEDNVVKEGGETEVRPAEEGLAEENGTAEGEMNCGSEQVVEAEVHNEPSATEESEVQVTDDSKPQETEAVSSDGVKLDDDYNSESIL